MSRYKLYTSVEIYNMALARIGCSQFITLFSDLSNEARIGKVTYQYTLERVLEEFPWPFASRFIALTEYVPPITTATSLQWHIDWWGGIGVTDVALAPKLLPDGWGNVYCLPADCMFPRSVWSGLNPVPPGADIPFRTVDNGMSNYDRVLFTNMSNAVLEYTCILEGSEDLTRGPVGDGDLTEKVLYLDDGSIALFDDNTPVEAL